MASSKQNVSRSNVTRISSHCNNTHIVKEKLSTAVDPHRICYFEAALLTTVLEDAIKEFRVIAECSNDLQVALAQADYEMLRALKYQVEQPLVSDELDDINPKKLDCEEYKLRKLFADRHFFREVLEQTFISMATSRKYTPVVMRGKLLLQKMAHYDYLVQEEMNNRVLRKDLKRQCRQQRVQIKSAVYMANCNIAHIKKSVEDAALNAEIRSRYVENWQNSRTEQNRQSIRDKEGCKENNIELFKHRYDQEQRVHAEVEMLATIQINEKLQEIETWMEKYEEDMEKVELKIQKMKNNHAKQEEKRHMLEKTIEEHGIEMKSWLKFKEDRENARLYSEKMNKSAIIVQAWWRGFLVRNQLGPYKPQKQIRKQGEKKKK